MKKIYFKIIPIIGEPRGFLQYENKIKEERLGLDLIQSFIQEREKIIKQETKNLLNSVLALKGISVVINKEKKNFILYLLVFLASFICFVFFYLIVFKKNKNADQKDHRSTKKDQQTNPIDQSSQQKPINKEKGNESSQIKSEENQSLNNKDQNVKQSVSDQLSDVEDISESSQEEQIEQYIMALDKERTNYFLSITNESKIELLSLHENEKTLKKDLKNEILFQVLYQRKDFFNFINGIFATNKKSFLGYNVIKIDYDQIIEIAKKFCIFNEDSVTFFLGEEIQNLSTKIDPEQEFDILKKAKEINPLILNFVDFCKIVNIFNNLISEEIRENLSKISEKKNIDLLITDYLSFFPERSKMKSAINFLIHNNNINFRIKNNIQTTANYESHINVIVQAFLHSYENLLRKKIKIITGLSNLNESQNGEIDHIIEKKSIVNFDKKIKGFCFFLEEGYVFYNDKNFDFSENMAHLYTEQLNKMMTLDMLQKEITLDELAIIMTKSLHHI